jgi:hypothetical protein
MAARFANIGHNTPLLLLSNFRDWLRGEIHLVHFVMDPGEQPDVPTTRANERESGGAQPRRAFRGAIA